MRVKADWVAFMRPDVLHAHANAAAIRGLPSEADDYLSEAFDLARATEQHARAYGALHDLARLGGRAPQRPRFSMHIPWSPTAPLRRHVLATSGPPRHVTVAELRCGRGRLRSAECVALCRRGCGVGQHLLERAVPTVPPPKRPQRARQLIGACKTADATPRVHARPSTCWHAPRAAMLASLASEARLHHAIAERLGISERTVEGHLQRVLDKLGVCSRAELGVALEHHEHSLGLLRAVEVGDERLPAEARRDPGPYPVRALAPAPAGRHDCADDGLPAHGPRRDRDQPFLHRQGVRSRVMWPRRRCPRSHRRDGPRSAGGRRLPRPDDPARAARAAPTTGSRFVRSSRTARDHRLRPRAGVAPVHGACLGHERHCRRRDVPAREAVRAAGAPLPGIVIPPGVDVERFRPVDDESRKLTRPRFGLTRIVRWCSGCRGWFPAKASTWSSTRVNR